MTNPNVNSQLPVLLVVDAPVSVRDWVAEAAGHMATVFADEQEEHPPQTLVVTLAQLWLAIEATTVDSNGEHWSIAIQGLPLTDPDLPNPSKLPPHALFHALGGTHG